MNVFGSRITYKSREENKKMVKQDQNCKFLEEKNYTYFLK